MKDKMLEPNEQAREKAREVQELARRITAELHSEHRRPCVRFTLEPGEPGIFESKAGGTPYLPRELPWPMDGEGRPLGLLAQIDCAGLGGLPDFPHTGLLQFFVGLDDMWGIDCDDRIPQKGFRVLYHEKVDRSVTAEEMEARRPPAFVFDSLPVLKPCRIRLSAPVEQGINENDPRFDALFAEKWNRLRPDIPIQRVWDMYKLVPGRLRDYSATEQPGWTALFHQLGGYPCFTQYDPRPGRYEDLDVLLFQLDSEMTDSGDLVLWGDCGVGNFFINREALKRRDFSRVLYTWDCG